jgi:membrane-bound serine protease (ClpP class)
MNIQRRDFAIVVIGMLLVGLVLAAESKDASTSGTNQKAAIITCKGDIDYGLYKSLKRRTQIALDSGVKYLIYEIGTYGGVLESADDISKYFILDLPVKNGNVHTVAFITTEAISAGSLISVSCRDIIMLQNTTIGDCAPITLGMKLEGVEREKAESFTRVAFSRAAQANGYPESLLKAMVTVQLEVYRIRNLQTGKYEFFEGDRLPKDTSLYDLNNKELINKNDELLTLTASQAYEYGIARAVVKDQNEALDFLARRDGITFEERPFVLETTWSEEVARWLNSTTVMGILIALALLGVYMEFSSPGLSLPGLVAAICIVIIIGSKYMSGLANWVEVVVLLIGVLLLLLEFFVIPGFGIAGFVGIFFVIAGIFGMLVKNSPEQLPWPQGPSGWSDFNSGIIVIFAGLTGFIVLAVLLSKYLPKIPIANRMVLNPPQEIIEKQQQGSSGTDDTVDSTRISQTSIVPPVQVGQQGISISQLRPAGKAIFNGRRLDVVSRGEVIEADRKIIVELIEWNRIVVKEIRESSAT